MGDLFIYMDWIKACTTTAAVVGGIELTIIGREELKAAHVDWKSSTYRNNWERGKLYVGFY